MGGAKLAVGSLVWPPGPAVAVMRPFRDSSRGNTIILPPCQRAGAWCNAWAAETREDSFWDQ